MKFGKNITFKKLIFSSLTFSMKSKRKSRKRRRKTGATRTRIRESDKFSMKISNLLLISIIVKVVGVINKVLFFFLISCK